MRRHDLYDEFLKAPITSDDRNLLEINKEKLLENGRFDGLPSFGTGGMRAIVELGSNRLNKYNIARLGLALAKTLNSGAKVVLGYDSRLSSEEFCRVTYHALRSQNIGAFVFKRPTPTPLVSFAVRELQAEGGVVITASHNPSQYNGFKVYGADGGQIIPPVDEHIQDYFADIGYGDLPKELQDWAETPVADEDLIEENIAAEFVRRLAKEQFVTSDQKNLRVLYSPLHGTGGWLFEQTFAALGFSNFQLLASEAEADGNFPSAGSLNPEEKEAFNALVDEGAKQESDILLATDPDADRVGCAIRSASGYEFLTGNQIGALLLESIARRKASQLEKPFICKTIVTSELQRNIATSYGVETVETLTGFKYIASEVARRPESYLFGGEESYGYLPIHWVRDKDSVSSAVALCELAESTPLVEALDQLHIKHGVYVEHLHNILLEGTPPGFIDELMQKLADPLALFPDGLGERKIDDVLDVRKGAPTPKTDLAKHLAKTLPHANVVQYWLAPEGRLTIRPSGTEPKVKIYVSLRAAKTATAQTLATIRAGLKKEVDVMLKQFLSRLHL